MPRQSTSPADYPQAVLQSIEGLAQNIVIARKRRGETQAQWARKLGVSQPTMARIERGDPAVAMASYVMCLWLINQANGLADLIAPQKDHAALEQEVARVRAKRQQQPASSTTEAPPARHGVFASQAPLEPNRPALARELAARPYHSANTPEAEASKSRSPQAEEPAERQNSVKANNPTAAGLSALLSQAKPRLK